MRLRGGEERQATVDDGDTGCWHTLHAYTDLTVARPLLPAGLVPPAPRDLARLERLDGRPAHNSGRLGWGELLAVADGVVAAGPVWQLLLLGCTRRDLECYQVYVRDHQGATVWPTHWIDTYADWARLRAGATEG